MNYSLNNDPNTPEYDKWVATFEKIRDELLAAFLVILDKDKWCKRALARDTEGDQLFNPSDPKAVQWCLLGAIYKEENWAEETLTFAANYAKKRGIDDLTRYNDHEGHAAVIILLVEMLEILGVELKFYDEDGKGEMKRP